MPHCSWVLSVLRGVWIRNTKNDKVIKCNKNIKLGRSGTENKKANYKGDAYCVNSLLDRNVLCLRL